MSLTFGNASAWTGNMSDTITRRHLLADAVLSLTGVKCNSLTCAFAAYSSSCHLVPLHIYFLDASVNMCWRLLGVGKVCESLQHHAICISPVLWRAWQDSQDVDVTSSLCMQTQRLSSLVRQTLQPFRAHSSCKWTQVGPACCMREAHCTYAKGALNRQHEKVGSGTTQMR